MRIPSFHRSSPFGGRQRHGIALIIVLACLVLLTVMVIAFLASISTEVQSSKFYANGSSVKLLAQSTTDLVMAEIRDATSDGSQCWASQPGMIRTYDNTGQPLKFYKLYSDDNMVTTTFDHTQPSLVPDGNHGTVAWYNQKGVYVDLNQPVTVNGINQYPIVDGDPGDLTSATFSTVTGNTTTPLPPKMTAWNPVPTATVKVLGSGTGLPNGFWLNSNTPAQNSTSDQAPMPVKWLYVLQDGQIAVPDSGSAGSTTVAFNNSSVKPTSTNPIIGRMAFWTDDETCKVNLNTAAEGTYWSVPMEFDNGDYALANNAPVNHEYQRYPGHPAMTSLSAIFNLTTPETIYSITPRLGPGGSQEGTVQTSQQKSFTPVTPNSNRLYSTTDEYIFQPTLSGSARAPNSALAGASALDQTALRKARFFITANSRAPDVNLFNMPRICMWPIYSKTDGQVANQTVTAFDQLIAFCSTMRTDAAIPNIYYFQRKDSTSPTVDLPSSKDDNVGLDRNKQLLNYLRYLTKQNIPGFGGNFDSKYNTKNVSGTGTDCDQILTEIFDYIRSTNLRDPILSNTSGATPFTPASIGGSGQVIPIEDPTTVTRGFGRFPTLRGGTFLFIANADDTTDPVGTPPPNDPLVGTPPPVAAGNVRVQACFLPQMSNPSVGSVFALPKFSMIVSGLNTFTLGGSNLGFTSPISQDISYTTSQGTTEGEYWGDAFGLRMVRATYLGTGIDLPKGTAVFSGGDITVSLIPYGTTDLSQAYQTVVLHFPSTTIPTPTVFKNLDPAMPNSDPPTGGFVSSAYVQVYNASNNLVTSFGTYFNMRYFVPSRAGYSGRQCLGATDGLNYDATFVEDPSGGTYGGSGRDVVRSVSASGDYRLIAALKFPQTDFSQSDYPFAPVGNYASATSYVKGNHNWWSGYGAQYFGALGGHLVQNANYDGRGAGMLSYTDNGVTLAHLAGGPHDTYNCADIPVNGVAMGSNNGWSNGKVLGDWDNGVYTIRDGPYINKADEGDVGNAQNKAYNWKAYAGQSNLPSGLFSPNRLIPSPVMLGSLPTGVFANRPWQTLLFRPGPIGHAGLGASTVLPGYTTVALGGSDQGPPYTKTASTSTTVQGPPDHLFLDLFSMPVVEPYAISEPLSTAGRINMNHLIVPFTYINRDTGLRALLKSEMVISFSDTQANTYKVGFGAHTPCRWPVNIDSTLSQFYTRRFNGNSANGIKPDIFRSPSEICEIDIVPDDSLRPANEFPLSAAASLNPTRANMDVYWNDNTASGTTTKGHRITGDNSRERIYATLYPRLTTKSNTYTIHFRVQTLKPALPPGSPAVAWTTWREGTDIVTGEYRGSQIIERYVDPNDSTLPDFADSTTYTKNLTLAPYYKFRILSTKQFAP